MYSMAVTGGIVDMYRAIVMITMLRGLRLRQRAIVLSWGGISVRRVELRAVTIVSVILL
jgi:hypothetical protein